MNLFKIDNMLKEKEKEIINEIEFLENFEAKTKGNYPDFSIKTKEFKRNFFRIRLSFLKKTNIEEKNAYDKIEKDYLNYKDVLLGFKEEILNNIKTEIYELKTSYFSYNSNNDEVNYEFEILIDFKTKEGNSFFEELFLKEALSSMKIEEDKILEILNKLKKDKYDYFKDFKDFEGSNGLDIEKYEKFTTKVMKILEKM
jgi:hypothetical protein